MNKIINNWRESLFAPVSASTLGLFRIVWGGVMFYHFLILLIGNGKYKYIDTIFHFKYPFFEWVQVMPAGMMHVVFWGGLIFSVLMSLGLFYKFTSRALFLLYSYVFLLDISFWNNHYYAYMLIGGFFAITDAHQALSIDKKRLNLDGWIPQWQLWLFQFQVIVIYFYGGLSKLQNKDWMENLSGYSFLYNNLDRQLFPLWMIYPLSLVVTYGGLVYDLCVGFLLKWRKTVWWCLPFILIFNLSNSFLFNIGSFPFAMLGSFALFIPIDWMDRQLSRWPKLSPLGTQPTESRTPNWQKQLIVYGLSFFVAFQLLFPMRSLFYAGSVFWTGEGKLCAWHMMSASTYVKAYEFEILEYDDSKKIITARHQVDTRKFLGEKQIRTMGSFPFVAPQFARFLKKEATFAGMKNVAVHSKIYVSKNYRPLTLIIDPDTDLTSVEVKLFGHNKWILRYAIEDGYFAK